ncbi:hypothetical protein RJ495_005097 [Pluralibacter gergoviae]|nr:hypothetical protein [Pluralibacter gergoviae]ELD4303983.1 hypothetical protein [Pluralibacter gergoviae]
MAMDIMAGSHIKVYIGDNTAAVATTFAEISEIGAFVAGSVTSNVIDVVEYNQLYNRKLLGSQAIENIDLKVYYKADDVQHKKLVDLVKSQTRCQIKIEIYENGTFTTGFYDIYRCFVSTFTVEGDKEEVVSATFTLAVDGAPLQSGLLPSK